MKILFEGTFTFWVLSHKIISSYRNAKIRNTIKSFITTVILDPKYNFIKVLISNHNAFSFLISFMKKYNLGSTGEQREGNQSN